MSLSFGAISCLSGPSNFSLPDSDWCFALVYRIDDNSGSNWNNLFSAGSVVGPGELDLSMGESSRTTISDALQLRVGDGTNLRFVTAANGTGILGQWAFVVAQRSGSEKQIWQCPMGGTPTKIAFTDLSLGATTHDTPLFIGRRSMNQIAAQTLNGQIAYVARGAFALSEDRMTALAQGVAPHRVAIWSEYLPLFEAGPTSLKSVIGNTVYTVTGSPSTGGQPCALW